MIILFYALFAFAFPNTGFKAQQIIDSNFKFAQEQYLRMIKANENAEENPRSINEDGTLKSVKHKDWTSGFFPGALWYLYEYTNDNKWKEAAEKFSNYVVDSQYDSTTHDVGFKMYCSYGNGYRLTNDKNYKKILLQSAKTLSTRFNPIVGCLRSWDHHEHLWQYPVIIDNMMNLELLFWATKESGDSSFYKIAVAHANTTMKNHFREDYSSYHVINYDTTTGEEIGRNTHQGYADESAWARGQAWGLYGYTMCYRETNDKKYLKQAEHIAEYMLNHKNFPKDMIMYWDFDAPNIPDEERDASAAAVMSSALYELSNYLPEKQAKYKTAADKILESLSSPDYRAEVGTNDDFLLMHSVGSKPGNSEIDVPLIYADYYFLEANLRKMEIEKQNTKQTFKQGK